MLFRSWNLGEEIVLELVSFVKVPVEWATPKISVVEYVNVLSFTMDVTVNDPLYPLLSAPVVFTVSVTFLMITISPLFKL